MSTTKTATVTIPAAPFSLREDGPSEPINPASPAPPSVAGSRIFDVAPSNVLSRPLRFIITTLIISSNLVQFISNFSTFGAGYWFSNELSGDASPGKSVWMVASYSVTQSSFVLISGRLGAIYGHQRVLLAGLTILTVLSIVNGFVTNYSAFIAVRALTGIGGGLLMPNAVAMIAIMVPPGRSRNISLGLFGASAPIGGWIGALLAGLYIEHAGWKWMFFTIALLGAAVFAGLYFLLPKEQPVDRSGKIDYIGAALGLSSLILFNVVWTEAPSVGWHQPYEIACLILSIVLFCSFLVWEKKYAVEPIMPVTIFRAPTFTALVFVNLLTYMSFGISLWYMIAWQQLIRHWSVLHFAIGWIPFCIGAVSAVLLAAWLIPRLPAQYIMAIGVGSVLLSNLLLATMPTYQIYWAQTFPAIVFSSICPDFVYVAAQIIASNSVGRRHQGVAGSLIGTLNLYGNSLGLGFAGTIEAQIGKNTGDTIRGYRAALFFGVGLAIAAMALDFTFVRMPKDEREGWEEAGDQEPVELQAVRGTATGVESGTPA